MVKINKRDSSSSSDVRQIAHYEEKGYNFRLNLNQLMRYPDGRVISFPKQVINERGHSEFEIDTDTGKPNLKKPKVEVVDMTISRALNIAFSDFQTKDPFKTYRLSKLLPMFFEGKDTLHLTDIQDKSFLDQVIMKSQLGTSIKAQLMVYFDINPEDFQELVVEQEKDEELERKRRENELKKEQKL